MLPIVLVLAVPGAALGEEARDLADVGAGRGVARPQPRARPRARPPRARAHRPAAVNSTGTRHPLSDCLLFSTNLNCYVMLANE